ncbi:hypothetical protein GCM10027062_03350 [Nocardioides hungaricus]
MGAKPATTRRGPAAAMTKKASSTGPIRPEIRPDGADPEWSAETESFTADMGTPYVEGLVAM